MATVTRRPATKRIKPRLKRPKAARQWPVDGVATPEEAAEFLRVSRMTAYRMIKSGRLPSTSIGENDSKRAKLRLSWAMLHRFVEGKSIAPSK